MLPDRVSNPGPLTSESGALPIAPRGLAYVCTDLSVIKYMFVRLLVRQQLMKYSYGNIYSQKKNKNVMFLLFFFFVVVFFTIIINKDT